MTYEEAETLGRGMGLSLPAEFVNNVLIHRMNLFPYSEAEAELDELRETARAAGVRFSSECYDAILDEDPEDDLCYVCRAIEEALHRE